MINFAVKLIATVALEAMQMGLQASQRTTGPRLSELTVTTAEFGTPIPRFLGQRKFACPVFHAEDLKEVKKTTKIKGAGKQTSFHYLGTFACAIADNAIDKVLKVWLDDHLIYDVTTTGPSSLLAMFGSRFGQGPGVNSAKYMRIYTGSEAQLPDPRYTSWCEDKYGANSAPAYRGVSYLFFEDLPLDNFGNRIPQISVLAVSASTANYPYEQVTETTVSTDGHYAGGGGWIAHYGNGSGDPINWFDAPSRKLIGSGTGSGVSPGTVVNVDLADDGTAYFFGQYIVFPSAFSALYTCSPLGVFSKVDSAGPWFSGPTRVFDLDSGRMVLTAVASANTGYLVSGTPTTDAQTSMDFALHGDGSVWALFEPVGSSNQFTLKRMTGTTLSYTVTGLVTRSSTGSASFCHVKKQAHWFVITDGKWYTINDDTTGSPGTIKASGAYGGNTINLPRKDPTASSFWSAYTEVSLVDGSTVRTVNPSNWIAENTNGDSFYDPINDAIWVYPQFTTHQTIRYLDRVASAGVTLAQIISAQCDAAGVEDYDASALTQIVHGYSWTRGDVKSQMEPLLDIHDVDARPHDFTMQFLRRGSAPSGLILTPDFAIQGKDSPRYKVTVTQDTDLPRMLRVNFADINFEQQTNNVLSPLTIDEVDTQRDIVLDLTTYAASVAEAQPLGDRYMRRQWNSREQVENSLTAQYLAMEPGDVTTLDLDGVRQNVRLTKQTIAGGRIDCTFVRDEQIIATLNSAAGPNMDARTVQTISIAGPVKGFLIDAPLKADADNDVRPLLYTGAGVYSGLSYPGAVVYEATGTGTSLAYDQLFDTVTTGSTWGICQSTLADVPSPWLWDMGNTLTVSLQSGMLTSVTQADIDATPTLNLILVGRQGAWEYVNFTTATLNGDGTYTLSGFKRGRRGTEGACSGHAAGEAFVFPSALDVKEMGTDEVGGDLSFKVQSIGRVLAAAPAIDVNTYTGASLKPYAPCGFVASLSGGDWTFTWVRRTRIGGSWLGGSTIPLSEATEAYELVIPTSGGSRTISASSPTATWTSAQQTADYGSPQSSLPTGIAVYQLSDAVGRGFSSSAPLAA